MANETPAQRLARWVTALRYEDLPPEAVRHAKRAVLDTLGVQLRGATLPWVQPAYRYASTIGSNGAATIAYHGDRVHAPYAAYVNSAFSYSCELQHHGSPDSAHVGVIVVPVAQALGEQLGADGREMIVAMAAGYEAQGRLGAAILAPEFPRHFDPKRRHFHLQGMLGVFGATAAAGRLLRLTAQELTHAFAIAGSHACGLLEYDQAGGEVKRIHGAIGARNGMQAALLARAGLTGPLSVFEGRHGFFAAFGGAPHPDPDRLFVELGTPFCITQCRYRIYPTIGTIHSPLDILGDLLAQRPVSHHEVRRVRVGVDERGLMHVGSIRRPHDVISAQASLAYAIAARLVRGSVQLETFIDPALWRDPQVLAVADRVEGYVAQRPGFPRYACIEMELSNGEVLRGESMQTRGSAELPFSEAVMAEKFRSLAGAVLPSAQVERIMDAVEELDAMASTAELAKLLCRS